MEISHRHTPVRRGAIGIFGCHIAKCFFRCRVCERMQKRHRSLETFLHFARARSRKLDTAKLLRDRMLVFGDSRQQARLSEDETQKAERQRQSRAYFWISERHAGHTQLSIAENKSVTDHRHHDFLDLPGLTVWLSSDVTACRMTILNQHATRKYFCRLLITYNI